MHDPHEDGAEDDPCQQFTDNPRKKMQCVMNRIDIVNIHATSNQQHRNRPDHAKQPDNMRQSRDQPVARAPDEGGGCARHLPGSGNQVHAGIIQKSEDAEVAVAVRLGDDPVRVLEVTELEDPILQRWEPIITDAGGLPGPKVASHSMIRRQPTKRSPGCRTDRKSVV